MQKSSTHHVCKLLGNHALKIETLPTSNRTTWVPVNYTSVFISDKKWARGETNVYLLEGTVTNLQAIA